MKSSFVDGQVLCLLEELESYVQVQIQLLRCPMNSI